MKEGGDTVKRTPLSFSQLWLSRPTASVKPQTFSGLTPLKSSQEAEEERTGSYSRNGKQQVNHLEDTTPIPVPWGFPRRGHREVAPHKPGHLHSRDLEAEWLHQHDTAAGLRSLLGLIAEAPHQAAAVLEAALLSALPCLTAKGLELSPASPFSRHVAWKAT